MSKRDKYIKKIHQQIDEWDNKITQTEKKIKKTKTEAKEIQDDLYKTLQSKRKSASEQLSKLNSIREDGWEDMVVGMENAMSELQKAYKRLKARF